MVRRLTMVMVILFSGETRETEQGAILESLHICYLLSWRMTYKSEKDQVFHENQPRDLSVTWPWPCCSSAILDLDATTWDTSGNWQGVLQTFVAFYETSFSSKHPNQGAMWRPYDCTPNGARLPSCRTGCPLRHHLRFSTVAAKGRQGYS